MPTEVRDAWDAASFKQRKFVRGLKRLCERAEVAGLHPAHSGWSAMLDHLEDYHKLQRAICPLIAWLIDGPTLQAAALELERRAAKGYDGGVGGSMFVALCQDWSGHLIDEAKKADRRRALLKRQQEAREEEARQKAEADRLQQLIAGQMNTLHPLGMRGVLSLLHRRMRHVDVPSRARIGQQIKLALETSRRIGKPGGALGVLLQSALLREEASIELVERGQPSPQETSDIDGAACASSAS